MFLRNNKVALISCPSAVNVIAFVTGWIDFHRWKRAKSQVNSFGMKEIEFRKLFMGKWFFIQSRILKNSVR